jgi:hypothetical protein
MPSPKTAAHLTGDGYRGIQIANWKPHSKNTLRGFFTVTLPSGMILHHVMLHERGKARWIGVPAREWVNDRGEKVFAKLVEFTDRRTANRFRDQVLAAFDRFMADRQSC